MPSQRRRDPPGPGAAALLVGGRFSRRAVRRGVRLRPRLLVAAVVVGHLGQHRTGRSAGGRPDRGGPSRSGPGELLARLARLLLRHLHGLAAALGDGQPAGEQAKTDQRSPPPPACWLAALLGSLPGHHVHLPPPAPADWVALLFPCSRGMKRTAARWRGASQASCDCLAPAILHRRRPRHPGRSSPVVQGLAPSSESMTTPSTRGRREAAAAKVRNRFIATVWIHHAPLPRPRGLSVIAGRRRWPARCVAGQPAPGPARPAAGPSATAAATAAEGGPGEAGPVERLAPRPELDLLPDLPSRCAWPAARTSAITRTDLRDLTRGCPSNRRCGGSRWVSAGLCGQAARAGAGSRLGSGSGVGGTGVGVPGRLPGV